MSWAKTWLAARVAAMVQTEESAAAALSLQQQAGRLQQAVAVFRLAPALG